MQPEHFAEWHALCSEARRELVENKERKGYVSRLRALVLPSFEDSCRYELLTPVRPSTTCGLAVKTVWRSSEDNAKFANPLARLRQGPGVRLRPTIYEYQNEIDACIVDDLCRSASALQVTVWPPERGLGLDGTSYELEVADVQRICRFRWWESPPKGWEPLAGLVQQIIAVCTRKCVGE